MSSSLFSVMELFPFAGRFFVSISPSFSGVCRVTWMLVSHLWASLCFLPPPLPHLCSLPPAFGVCLSWSLLLLFLLSLSTRSRKETEVERPCSETTAIPLLSTAWGLLTQRLRLWALRHLTSPVLSWEPKGP